ncbi:hypothetical protein [Serinibacter arcticus]|uniref:hypothetical protein n=1 Tax=Serinibacter arcticus TaxID=1655435 RepID=UPI0011B21D36|nr:hypothetical protein [Serinibacter arcticus]
MITSPRRRALVVPVLLAGALALTACSSSGEDPDASGAPSSSSASPSASPSATPEPSETTETSAPPSPSAEESSTTATPEPEFAVAPAAQLDAGVVAAGAPVTVQGDGPATVSFGRALVRIVATLDCSGCTGPVSLNGPDRLVGDAFGAGTGPWSGTMLVDFLSTVGDQVYVEATGPWTLELFALDDLPLTEGPTSGTGHSVLVLGGGTTGFAFHCRPVDGETCRANSYTLTGAGTIAGASSEIEETTTVDVELPAVVGIKTNGEWSVTP